jgi:hypothetical protein
MTNVEKALDFAKLNGSNYRDWSWRMKLYLSAKGLFEHAEGTGHRPADGGEHDAERSKFDKEAHQAHAVICLAVEDSQLVHVRNSENAADAWKALKDQFNKVSLLQKVRLRQKYYGLRLQDGDDLTEHINKLKQLHDELRDLGAEIEDNELAMTLLGSLQLKKYEPLILTLDCSGETNMSFERVKQLLLRNDDRASDSQLDVTELAHVAGSWRRRGGGEQRTNFTPVPCYNCQKSGHLARDCPDRPNSYGDGRDYRGDFRGHDSGYRGGRGGYYNQRSQHGTEIGLYSFTVPLAKGFKMQKNWVVDSGASMHMTSDIDLMDNYVQFSEMRQVQLGDGRVIDAVGKGAISCQLGLYGNEMS